jgi:hypothetical protein
VKNILFRLIVILAVFMIDSCDKPDALKEKAYFEVENYSSMYNITGVFYANTGYGTNRISSNIGPGQSKTFTLDAEGDYIYNIKVTSDNPNDYEYSNEGIHFYDERRITVELWNDGWESYYPW